MSVITVTWFVNTKRMNKELISNANTTLQKYLNQKANQRAAESTRHLQHYFSLVSSVLARDAYNMDYEAIQEALNKLLKHKGICSLTVTDTISNKNSSSMNNQCVNKTTYEKDLAIIYNKEVVAKLHATYHLDFVEHEIQEAKAFWHKALGSVKEEIDSIHDNYLWIQVILFALAGLSLLLWIWRQLQRSVVSPITKLLQEMQNANSLVALEKPIKEEEYDTEEISQVAKYFQQHIKKLLAKLHYKANVDALTGLYSRQKLLDDMDKNKNCLLAIMDINDFKEVNNFFGSDLGDEILQNLAHEMEGFFGQQEFSLYHTSGDEFAIVYKNSSDSNQYCQILQNFMEEFGQKELNIKGNLFSLTLSAGVTSGEKNPKQAISKALLALKQAKNTKQNCLKYHKGLDIIQIYKNNISTTKLIKKALKKKSVIPYYQPIYNIAKAKVTKYESLMRIKDETGEIISPALFLDIARKSALYNKLSKNMIATVMEQMTGTTAEVSINLSIEDILNEEFTQWLFKRLQKEKIAPRILFEITEQEGISNFESVKIFIDSIKALGAKVAIDDFGSGYSNFENLVHLNIDYLKIDGSLIKNITKDASFYRIVKTIVNFAKELEIKTVAEFVSSQEIYESIKELGIDYAQGFYIGKPQERS